MLKPGLYEQVINSLLNQELSTKQDELKYTEKIDSAEASGILTRYLSEVIQKSLDSVSDSDELESKVAIVNKVVELLSKETQQEDIQNFTVDEKAEQLLAFLSESDPMYKIGKRKAKDIVRPETSVAQSSLFTGAVHEPQMYLELKKEMETADRIDMLVSFIKWSGLRLLIDKLFHA